MDLSSQENLAQYPSDTGNIELPSHPENQEDNLQEQEENFEETPEEGTDEKSPFENEDEELLQAFEEYEEKQGDLPKPRHTLNENIATDTIDNYVKRAVEELQVGNNSSNPEKVPWPEQLDEEPVSDFSYGYFTKCFPHLFPDGMADITKSRPGVQPTMKQWVQHLLKVDRRFAKDPQFILVVTNIMQKKQALGLGNLYVNSCIADKNSDKINQKLKEGDDKTLRSLYCFRN